ncbi:MAG: hypothetical protein GXP55_18620 [Deltaproteobacteria bacterium]|nr:hypothetical protein [Deltaproteobacteria bacterium]
MGSADSRALVVLFAFESFLGATLLFGLEPMVGRMLLPTYGGAYYVWTTALTFFSGALFVGYLYAHLLARRLGRLHLLVLAAALLFMPIVVPAATSEGAPLTSLLFALTRGVLVPFVALSTTAVVMQLWWSRLALDPASTHRLYAASNAGSMVALVAYVLFVDRVSGLMRQREIFTLLYALYLALAALLAWLSHRRPAASHVVENQPEASPARDTSPARGRVLSWLALSACPSALLLAVTNVLVFEVGSAPFVWVLPLALYLLSFVVAFSGRPLPRAVDRLWPFLAAIGVFAALRGGGGGEELSLVLHLVVLFVLAVVAHTELYRRRGPAEELTRFYLVVALGGWAGGALVALVAPSELASLAEYPLAIAGLVLTFAVLKRRALRSISRATLAITLVFGFALMLASTMRRADDEGEQVLERSRSPYGLYRVTSIELDGVRYRQLMSGRIVHGREREGAAHPEPLAYYHRTGPLGDVARAHLSARRVGVVGLGVGATAATFSSAERIVFYEIDPEVLRLAREYFHFISDDPRLEFRIGDARRVLTRESAEGAEPFDLLVVDAFTGDAVPTHLLTEEALRLYMSRLGPGGVLMIHASNLYYDLASVIASTARSAGLAAAYRVHAGPLAPGQTPSRYFALAAQPETLDSLDALGWRRTHRGDGISDVEPFTDDHADTFGAFLRAL